MSHSSRLILQVHVSGAEPYGLGDEIWQQSLSDAIRAEAATTADYAGPDLLRLSGHAGRIAVRDRVVAEMTAALRHLGDTYTAPDGVAYTLSDQAQLDLAAREDTLASMSPTQSAPIVEEVLRFEDLAVGSSATRCAVVRWRDGTESQALAWYADDAETLPALRIGRRVRVLRSDFEHLVEADYRAGAATTGHDEASNAHDRGGTAHTTARDFWEGMVTS